MEVAQLMGGILNVIKTILNQYEHWQESNKVLLTQAW